MASVAIGLSHRVHRRSGRGVHVHHAQRRWSSVLITSKTTGRLIKCIIGLDLHWKTAQALCSRTSWWKVRRIVVVQGGIDTTDGAVYASTIAAFYASTPTQCQAGKPVLNRKVAGIIF